MGDQPDPVQRLREQIIELDELGLLEGEAIAVMADYGTPLLRDLARDLERESRQLSAEYNLARRQAEDEAARKRDQAQANVEMLQKALDEAQHDWEDFLYQNLPGDCYWGKHPDLDGPDARRAHRDPKNTRAAVRRKRSFLESWRHGEIVEEISQRAEASRRESRLDLLPDEVNQARAEVAECDAACEEAKQVGGELGARVDRLDQWLEKVNDARRISVRLKIKDQERTQQANRGEDWSI